MEREASLRLFEGQEVSSRHSWAQERCMRIEGADEVPHTPHLRATSRANSTRPPFKSNFSADQLG